MGNDWTLISFFLFFLTNSCKKLQKSSGFISLQYIRGTPESLRMKHATEPRHRAAQPLCNSPAACSPAPATHLHPSGGISTGKQSDKTTHAHQRVGFCLLSSGDSTNKPLLICSWTSICQSASLSLLSLHCSHPFLTLALRSPEMSQYRHPSSFPPVTSAHTFYFSPSHEQTSVSRICQSHHAVRRLTLCECWHAEIRRSPRKLASATSWAAPCRYPQRLGLSLTALGIYSADDTLTLHLSSPQTQSVHIRGHDSVGAYTSPCRRQCTSSAHTQALANQWPYGVTWFHLFEYLSRLGFWPFACFLSAASQFGVSGHSKYFMRALSLLCIRVLSLSVHTLCNALNKSSCSCRCPSVMLPLGCPT